VQVTSYRLFVQLMDDLRRCKVRTLQKTGRCDTASIAAELARAGHRVILRTALGGGTGQNCFQVRRRIGITFKQFSQYLNSY